MIRVIALAGAVLAAAVPARAAEALLGGLDKVTATVTQIRAPIDQPVRFGALEITVKACVKRPPEETPESSAFLQITETPPDQPKRQVFSGWMFASSPALNAMQHPVYDIWVLDCR